MRRLLFFYIFIISAFSCRAGLDTSSFHHFNLKNGLPSNNVYSLIRDKDGYTWFATDNGLVKYNGYTFEIFNTDNGGLPANDVFEMHEDTRGRIWLRTFSYDFGFIENGKFKKLSYYNSVDRIATPQYLTNYKGLVYFSELLNAGYKIIVVDDDVIKIFPLPVELLKSHGIDSIYNITLGKNFDIKIWSADNRLYEWDASGHEPVKYLGKYPEEFRYVYVHRVVISPSEKYYLFKPGANELYFFDVRTLEYKYKFLSEWGADASEKIVTISPDFYKNNFIEHTAIITNTHTYTFSTYMELLARQKNSDIIPSMLQLAYRMKDNTGVYWYCTNGDGVWMKPADYDFYSNRQKIDALDKSKYVGTIGNISLWWDNVTSELYEVKQRKINRRIKFDKGFEVRSASGNDTAIYIATSDGIYRYDKNSGNIFDIANAYEVSDFMFGFIDRNNKEKSNKLLLQSFRKIQVIGNSIYGFNSIGLIKMTLEGDKIIPEKFDRERFSDCFYDEKNKAFYAYSNQKILVNSMAGDSSKVIDHKALKNLGIGNIKHLEKDSFGNVWILDDNSLFIYNEQKGKVKRIENSFSFSDCAFRIMGDKFFVTGKFGIGYATIEGLEKVSSFSIIPNSGMVHYARVEDFVVSKDGYAMLNNDVEWMSFSLDSLTKYAIANDKHNSFFSIATLSPYKKAIHNNDTLKIGQAETILKLDAINYYGKGIVKYVYRVSGSAKWETSTSGEVFLETLTAGNYHKIECRVKDDLWESNIYTFYVYRYPMWWQTSTWKTAFWISGVLLFIGLVVITMLITRFYVAKKNERRRALTELELKAIHSQINPHFIFNTLSAALFYINKKRFDDAYAHVNKFSHLLRSYLKSSQDRYVMLEEEIKMLRNYIELQQIRFEEKFDYKIEIDNKLPTSNIRIPSLLLQPLVENAINHGLFHKEKGGILLLKFEQGTDSSELVCTIEDNGVGRDTARKINEANSTKESYGTKLTNQLLEVFKLYENLDIKLKYIDKELPETGTIVTLVLKNVKYVT